jgi:D-sedoheptulose 7-phosphate isomerase
MSQNMSEKLLDLITEVKITIANPDTFPFKMMTELASEFIDTLAMGNKIAFVGNGGSAAEAMHIAAEFTGKCVVDHKPLDVICLNESQSALTAIANDYGVENIFSRQVEAHLKANDLIIGLTTSGTSINVLNALAAAKKIGAKTMLWTGSDAPSYPEVRIWRTPTSSTPRSQEIHLIWGHMLAEIVELHFQ